MAEIGGNLACCVSSTCQEPKPNPGADRSALCLLHPSSPRLPLCSRRGGMSGQLVVHRGHPPVPVTRGQPWLFLLPKHLVLLLTPGTRQQVLPGSFAESAQASASSSVFPAPWWGQARCHRSSVTAVGRGLLVSCSPMPLPSFVNFLLNQQQWQWQVGKDKGKMGFRRDRKRELHK